MANLMETYLREERLGFHVTNKAVSFALGRCFYASECRGIMKNRSVAIGVLKMNETLLSFLHL